jgi:hypothetical protein
MKLYLREILKEANALGFGAPGQGGNSNDVSMAQTAPGPMASPALMPNRQSGGMQLPASNGVAMGSAPGQLNQINTQASGFKTNLM